ncbi:MAG: glycosyltransferase family 2 protein [Gemmataceae bacterium]
MAGGPTPAVWGVVLNWNQSRMTLDCVASLRAQTAPVARLVVVDNGSRADERRLLIDGLPAGTELVRLPANRGFAGGMNAGLRAAARGGAGYIWLMNNDAFPAADCLAKLAAALTADPALAAVTPKLVGPDGTEQHAGGRYRFDRADCEGADAAAVAAPPSAPGYWLTGTAPLVRATALAQVGGFDDRFFAYWEDVDLCLRLTAAGYRLRAVPEATAVHLTQGSSGGDGAVASPFAVHLTQRNRFRMVRKHAPPGDRVRQLAGLGRQGLDAAGCLMARGEAEQATVLAGAVVAGLLSEAGPPRWFPRRQRLLRFLARRPWRLVQVLGWVERRADARPAGRPGGA